MSNNYRKVLFAFWLIASISLSSARGQGAKEVDQSRGSATSKAVINLWPGVAPGSEQWKQPETTLGSGDTEHIVNVTTPTLTA